MRISTIQAFNNSVNGISRNYADLNRTFEQISTGKRILTPADARSVRYACCAWTRSRG